MERQGVNNAPEGIRPTEAPNQGVERNIKNGISQTRSWIRGGRKLRMEQLEDRNLTAVLVQGIIGPAETPLEEQPQYAVSLTNQEVFYDMLNADGTANAEVHWIGVETGNDPYKVNYPTNFGSDGSPFALQPSPAAELKKFFLIRGDLEETQKYRYLFGVEGDNNAAGNMSDFLRNATIYVGFGELPGSPTSVQEAIDASEGIVLSGSYPGDVAVDQEWILHGNAPVVQPLTGDYNNNGTVDAADYVLWRKQSETPGGLLTADGNVDGRVDAEDYGVWRSNFGNTRPLGSGAGALQNQAGGSVPEASTVVLAGAGAAGIYALTNRTRSSMREQMRDKVFDQQPIRMQTAVRPDLLLNLSGDASAKQANMSESGKVTQQQIVDAAMADEELFPGLKRKKGKKL